MSEPRQSCERGVNGLKKYLVGVAVTVTAALLGQSMALVWWAATITTRVEHAEKAIDGLDGRVHMIETARSPRPS